MGRKPRLSVELKIELLERYLSGESQSKLAEEYRVHVRTIEQWGNKYRVYGAQIFQSKQGRTTYSDEFKVQVIQDYLQDIVSVGNLAIKYNISSPATIRTWIKKYNGHKSNIKSNNLRRTAMTKGRKTTLTERIEIVSYCIERSLDYTATAEQFQVSYDRVYRWVKKYQKQGVSGLKDNRGKGKDLEDMNELERLQAEIKLLQSQNTQLQMENDVLKKADEIERRLISVYSNKKHSTKR
jgi:transposase-like protein